MDNIYSAFVCLVAASDFDEGVVLTDSIAEPPDPPHPVSPVCLSNLSVLARLLWWAFCVSGFYTRRNS